MTSKGPKLSVVTMMWDCLTTDTGDHQAWDCNLVSQCFGLFRKHYDLFSKDGYVVNVGYFGYEKYSFFEALAGDTAIVWCSYK